MISCDLLVRHAIKGVGKKNRALQRGHSFESVPEFVVALGNAVRDRHIAIDAINLRL